MMDSSSQSLLLAQEVLSIAKAQLLVGLRFMDRALFELKPEENDEFSLATDGRHLFFQPLPLLHAYRRQQGYAVRIWAHMLMHCLFRHMFISGVEEEKWDLACDLAAEAILTDLKIRQLQPLNGRAEREKTLCKLQGSVKLMTAEQIYRYLLDNPMDEHTLQYWQKLFQVDDHTLWHHPSSQGGGAGNGGNDEKNHSDNEGCVDVGENGLNDQSLQSMWQEISESIQTDLETFSKEQGTEAGSMLQSLRALNREKCDYRQFLSKFATRTEVMRLSPDEFDYIFYTYGLTLYKDMPLIEPLEYREDKRIREFVIAIDTSGSVAGDQVQNFLQKTYTILKQEETFDRRFNLHIIQCDAKIQEDSVIRSQEDFDRYIASMQIKGLGGTDFRPVFEYVEKLRRDRQFYNLKGLLYFTDGYGTFPAKQPDYLTAFVFVDDEAKDISVPPWAVKVILETEELR